MGCSLLLADIAKLKAEFARIQSGRTAKAPAVRRAKASVPTAAPAKNDGTATGDGKPSRPPSSDPIAAAITRARTAADLTQTQPNWRNASKPTKATLPGLNAADHKRRSAP